MSVQRYETADGTKWRVRWREHDGRMRSRTFLGKREASAFDADIRTRKFTGNGLPRTGKDSLATAYDEWFRLRGTTLASSTQRTYRAVWDAHVRNRFDHHRLNELAAEPQLFEELLADMRDRDVGPAAQRKALVVMSAVLTAAVEWNKIPTNPLWRMRKPPATRQRHPHPFPPVVVERIRLRMTRRDTKDSSGRRALADGCFVTLMAYAGLRPSEALALRWADIGSHTIAVDKSVRDGAEAPTKTGAKRTVRLAAPLQEDLDKLRKAAGMPGPDGLVLPSADGNYWTRSALNNWRNRVWKDILGEIAGHHTLASIADARPYDCRHTFVSMHLRAGDSPLEVAQWAGHSPAVMFSVYSSVIEELRGEPIIPVEEQIRRARYATDQAPSEMLDEITADLVAHPTVTSGGAAASVLFDPTTPTLQHPPSDLRAVLSIAIPREESS